jgi:hypothetical protein
MKFIKAAITVCCVALMGVAFAPGAQAADWSRKSAIAFSGPVSIPGMRLAEWRVLPVAYVFKSPNVLSKDEANIHTPIPIIPIYRMEDAGGTMTTFTESPADEPVALRTWFYPGAKWSESCSTRKLRRKLQWLSLSFCS